jgi:hypothetical protein
MRSPKVAKCDLEYANYFLRLAKTTSDEELTLYGC